MRIMTTQTPTIVIYHKADFDGIFCREIAKKFLPHATLTGWDYGDPEPLVPDDHDLFILDLSVPGLMNHPRLTWIDHHKTAIDTYPSSIPGFRIDGVAACRLAWQWFFRRDELASLQYGKEAFVDRKVVEPLAVRLAGEYDIWDKRDPRAELFQHGLRSQDISDNMWDMLLVNEARTESQVDVGTVAVEALLEAGEVIEYFRKNENKSIILGSGFDLHWEGLTFLACNAARYNSLLFEAGILPHHDALLGFSFRKDKWTISLYGCPGKPDIDLSVIAKRHGGGGHKQACGFTCIHLPFFLSKAQ